MFLLIQKKQVQALKTKPEPEKPMIPKRSGKDARDAREVARKLIKSGNINIKKPEKIDQVQFKRPKGQEKKKTLPEPYHPFSTASIEDDSSSSKSPLPTEKSDG